MFLFQERRIIIDLILIKIDLNRNWKFDVTDVFCSVGFDFMAQLIIFLFMESRKDRIDRHWIPKWFWLHHSIFSMSKISFVILKFLKSNRRKPKIYVQNVFLEIWKASYQCIHLNYIYFISINIISIWHCSIWMELSFGIHVELDFVVLFEWVRLMRTKFRFQLSL